MYIEIPLDTVQYYFLSLYSIGKVRNLGLTTSNETAPTVEIKLERVQRLGKRFFIQGYSLRMVCEL